MNSSAEYEPLSNPPALSSVQGEERERLKDRVWRYVRILGSFVQLLIGLMLDQRVDRKVKIFVGAVLAYVFAPVDFIPELFSGLFGMLDDFVLSAFALNVILNWVDPAVVRSHWRGEEDLLETVQKGMKTAELLVPEAIVKKIQSWVGRHAEKAVVKAQKKTRTPRKKTSEP
jgi:uncharacterized membrane protein YkvA (DUF1232 family)